MSPEIQPVAFTHLFHRWNMVTNSGTVQECNVSNKMLMRWGLYRALQQNKVNQQKKTLPNQKRQNIHEQQWQSNDKMTEKTKLATAAIYDWHSHIQSYSSFVQIPTGKAYRCINDRLHFPENHIQ